MSVPYWRTRDKYYRMIGSKCNKCGAEFFPAVNICRKCHATDLKEAPMPQIGTLLSFTMQRESVSGFEEQEPMCFGLVEFKNGVRVVGQLVDIPFDSLKVGSRVRTVFRRVKSDGPSGQIFYGYKFGPLRGIKP